MYTRTWTRIIGMTHGVQVVAGRPKRHGRAPGAVQAYSEGLNTAVRVNVRLRVHDQCTAHRR
jgi:hypothetical protein